MVLRGLSVGRILRVLRGFSVGRILRVLHVLRGFSVGRILRGFCTWCVDLIQRVNFTEGAVPEINKTAMDIDIVDGVRVDEWNFSVLSR